jgi:hypothetical protein
LEAGDANRTKLLSHEDSTPYLDLSNLEISHRDFVSYVFPVSVRFKWVRFPDITYFGKTEFAGEASFACAHFNGTAEVSGAQLNSKAGFKYAQFSGKADFGSAQFNSKAWFGHAQFNNEASFMGTQFCGTADFGSAQFSGKADFWDAKFAGKAIFATVRFHQGCAFQAATFAKKAIFSETGFHRAALFHAAHFHTTTSFRGATWHCLPDFSDVIWQRPPDPLHVGNLRTKLHQAESYYRKRKRKRCSYKCKRWIHKRLGLFSVSSCKHGYKHALKKLDEEYIDRIMWQYYQHPADKFRALRLIAKAGDDHEREMAFFAWELRAKRRRAYQRSAGWKLLRKDAWEGHAYSLYDLFGGFGRSLKRPALGLFAVLLAGTFALYGCMNPEDTFWHNLSITASYMLPFLGASSDVRASGDNAYHGRLMHSGWSSASSPSSSCFSLVLPYVTGSGCSTRLAPLQSREECMHIIS